jgi:GntR family transcriptional regulator
MKRNMINRDIPIPLYYQVMQEIKHSIDSGELKPGDRIPTETTIMKRYGISRATVRQALLQLVSEGYLWRLKAKGTFVNSSPERPRFLGTLKGFSEEMRQKGIPFETRVLVKDVISAPVRVAEKLRIAKGDSVFHLKRLRLVQDDPVLIGESYLPANICPGIEEVDFAQCSLYDTLESSYGVVLHHGRREFEPVMPSSGEEVQLLHISPKIPILYVESLVYSANNMPVEYVVIKMRGRFSVDLMQTLMV